MNWSTALPMLKMALGALDRGNLDLARGYLVDVVGNAGPVVPTSTTSGDVAVSITLAASALGYTPRHVRSLVKRGALGDAVIGSGRATRIIVSKALEALRGAGPALPTKADEVSDAGARWASRSRLQVVEGGRK